MRSDRNKGRSGKGVYTPGSDYERDVELYRQIVGDSKDTGHYSHSRAAGEAPASKPQPRPSQRMEAGDGGTPHIRKKKKTQHRIQDAGDGGRPGDGKPVRPSGKRRKKYKLNKKGHRIRRVICIILALLVALTACAFFYFNSMLSNLDKVQTSKSDFGINDGVSTDLWKYTDIAVMGSDARKGESYDDSRTDAIIIMRINKLSGEVRLISIMRDSYMRMAYSDGSTTYSKITHANVYGGGVNTCKAINQALDLNITQFMIFNWKAVADTVDSLGGIELNIRRSELSDLARYGNETANNVGGTYHAITKTGKQTLDGVQVATYCRIRKTSGGDNGRARRYKATLSAIIKKAKSGGPDVINKVADKALPEIRTNISNWSLFTYVLQAGRYNITRNIAYPHKYYGGILSDGLWYAVPRTLESNAVWLHKKAFDQTDYQPSSTCIEISNEIINRTGIQ